MLAASKIARVCAHACADEGVEGLGAGAEAGTPIGPGRPSEQDHEK